MNPKDTADFKDTLQQLLEEGEYVLVTKSFIETQTELNRQMVIALEQINSPALCMPLDFGKAADTIIGMDFSDVENRVVAQAMRTPEPLGAYGESCIKGFKADMVILDDLAEADYDKAIYNGCTTRAIPIREFGVKINGAKNNPIQSGYSVVYKQLRRLNAAIPDGHAIKSQYFSTGLFREVKSTKSGEVDTCFTEAGQRWFVEQMSKQKGMR